MNSVRDFVNVTIAIVLLSFMGISLARITYFLLHNYNIL
jgi:hypothetical protein